VYRPRRELLSSAGLAGNQHRRVRACHPPQPLVDATHRSAVADEIVIQLEGGLQPLGLALQGSHVPDILDGDGGNSRDSSDELQVLFIECCTVRRDEIDCAQHRLAHRHRDAEERANSG
jgi:hypothetical protein